METRKRIKIVLWAAGLLLALLLLSLEFRARMEGLREENRGNKCNPSGLSNMQYWDFVSQIVFPGEAGRR